MKNISKEHNPFQGLWVIVCTQQKNRSDKWITVRRFHFKDYVWFFQQEKSNEFHDNGCTFNGDMTESCTGIKESYLEYTFFRKINELFIDHSDYDDNGIMWACYNDRYRVMTNGNTLTLYDIADFGDTPEDYLVRIVLKRDTVKNRLVERFKALFLPKISYYRAGCLL